MPQKIDVVVGAQYGSEAKGHVTAQLVKSGLRAAKKANEVIGIEPTIINIRVAGPNAGHTVYDDEGNRFPLRQIPVGAALGDEVVLYIAPGSEIEPEVLYDEILLLRDHGHSVENLFVSPEATLIEPKHKQDEADATLVARAGSTGKGIGAARADRLMRKAKRVIDDPDVVERLTAVGVALAAPEDLYSHDDFADAYQHIIVEGTQGYGLGLHAGHYPQCTSSDTTADAFLTMAGLQPWRASVIQFDVYAVARVYPIRVAGNSGPLAGETTWEDLGLPEERTTVTQLVRRVGEWDTNLVRRAVQANGGAGVVHVVVTMLDQKFPGIAGFNGDSNVADFDPEVVQEAEAWLRSVEDAVGTDVAGFTTSPTDIAWVVGGSVEAQHTDQQVGTDPEVI